AAWAVPPKPATQASTATARRRRHAVARSWRAEDGMPRILGAAVGSRPQGGGTDRFSDDLPRAARSPRLSPGEAAWPPRVTMEGTMRIANRKAALAAGLILGVAAAASAAGATPPAASSVQPSIPEMPTLRHVDVADGLPSRNINSLASAPDGYLWLATTDGLARYDGIGMRVWRHVPDDPESLPGNYLTVLLVAPDGRVWVAPEGRGLSVLDPAAGDGFRHYRSATHPAMGSDEVWA